MTSKLPFWVAFALSALLLASCSKTVPSNLDQKTDYFPLEQGHSVIYDVDTVQYSPLYFTGKDTFYWEVRETIIDSYKDLEGRTVYKFERSQRKPGETTFRPKLIGIRLIDGTRAEQMENNLRFIPLVFPPTEGVTWDGNAFLNTDDSLAYYQDWSYTVLRTDTPATINGLQFDATTRVQEVEQEDLLSYRNSEAVYARGAGLVERTRYNLWFVGSNIPILPWEQKATNGFITHWKVKSVN